jgi:uncharacterized surface protein with fasciclin (FAS1) repeats
MGKITILNGDTATAEVIDGVAYIAGVPISNANIRTSNGIIHVLDAVMIPPSSYVLRLKSWPGLQGQ